MADVFISYAREDRATAAALADAFQRRGWSVWWDREIVAGESFDRAIERELTSARVVVVLWSERSVDSEWVRNEAADAAARGVLVPAMLDGATPPLEFRRRQAADLRGWSGEGEHEGFDSLRHGIAARIVVSSAPVPPVVAVSGPPRRRRRIPAIALVMAAVVAVALVWWLGRRPGAPSGLADAVVGIYDGRVYSDAKGHGQSDVTVTVTKIGPRRVRVSADYSRLATIEVDVTRVLDDVMSAGGPVTFMLEPNGHLTFSPDGEVSYEGRKR